MRNQEQISQFLVGPEYRNPDTGRIYKEKNGLNSQRNREYQITQDEDNAESLKISIRDIDEAIIYYFKNVIRPQVDVNGKTVSVPITYATPERWLEVQKNGIYRDKEGKKQLPVIIFKRNSISRNRSITTKLDANYPHNFYVTAVDNSNRNSYTRFDLLHNRVPEQRLIVTVVPDYVKIDYSCTIMTDLVSQMNPIVEAINFASDSYWGDPEKFKFQAIIDSFKTDISTGKNEDRIVKTDFGIKLNGYLLPDTSNANTYVNLRRHNKTNVQYVIQESTTTV